jgi:ubiquinone/menaquinone biosynthesis C-methylase UbiE
MEQGNAEQLIYSRGRPLSLIDRATLRVRRRIYQTLARLVDLNDLYSILDVGVTADQSYLCSNYLENHFPHKERVTALSDQQAKWLEDMYQGLRFVQGDGCHLPFADASYDLVFSSAVWEHVGSREKQLLFLQECLRVADRYVFITTPNRWHPFELHTGLPFIHWLPNNLCRNFHNWLSYGTMVSEGKLNLLSRKDIKQLMSSVNAPGYAIHSAKFLGIRSNLLLFIDKKSPVKKSPAV